MAKKKKAKTQSRDKDGMSYYGFLIPQDLKEWVDTYAAETERKPSAVLRLAVREYKENHG